MRAATAGLWKDVASGIGLGVGSGAMTAFLGAGGGMTSFFGVRFVAPNMKVIKQSATALAGMTATSFAGALTFQAHDHVSWPTATSLMVRSCDALCPEFAAPPPPRPPRLLTRLALPACPHPPPPPPPPPYAGILVACLIRWRSTLTAHSGPPHEACDCRHDGLICARACDESGCIRALPKTHAHTHTLTPSAESTHPRTHARLPTCRRTPPPPRRPRLRGEPPSLTRTTLFV